MEKEIPNLGASITVILQSVMSDREFFRFHEAQGMIAFFNNKLTMTFETESRSRQIAHVKSCSLISMMDTMKIQERSIHLGGIVVLIFTMTTMEKEMNGAIRKLSE